MSRSKDKKYFKKSVSYKDFKAKVYTAKKKNFDFKKIKKYFAFTKIKNGVVTLIDENQNLKIILNPLDSIILLDGDIVTYDYRTKKLTEVVKRSANVFEGEVVRKKNKNFFKIKNSPQDQLFSIENYQEDKKFIRVIRYPTKNEKGVGVLVDEVAENEVDLFQVEHQLQQLGIEKNYPLEFDGEIKLSESRRILTKIPFVTIDGKDAKDYDDAVYANFYDDKVNLIVAIADVASYVTAGSSLDSEAKKRANSFYLLNNVYPMLPFELSADICSLKPNQERLAMVIDMHFDRNYQLLSLNLEEAVIKSVARLTYEEFEQNSVIKSDLDFIKNYQAHLEFSAGLGLKRKNEGAIELNLSEPSYIFNDDGKLDDIKKSRPSLIRKLIEQYMVESNNAVGSYAIKNKIPLYWRNHDRPNIMKITELRRNVAQYGIKTTNVESHLILQRILAAAENKINRETIDYAVLRSLAQAKYGVKPLGHYGLASRNYCHFTSPIRRYADLFNHQNIKNFFNKEKLLKTSEGLADHLSDQERNSSTIERTVKSIFGDYLLKNNNSAEKYAAVVKQVQAHGIWIELEDHFIEGFIPISNINDNEYYFDGYKNTLNSKDFKITIGQKLLANYSKLNQQFNNLEFIWLSWK